MKTTVKQIFDYISGMNPTISNVSSLGWFVSNFNRKEIAKAEASKQFKKEFFSKKFTMDSANAFLAN